jgi:hypothetical protein
VVEESGFCRGKRTEGFRLEEMRFLESSERRAVERRGRTSNSKYRGLSAARRKVRDAPVEMTDMVERKRRLDGSEDV